MVGAALALDRASPIDVRAAYRRTWSATEDPRPGDPSSGVNHETVALTADARWRDRFFLAGGARYNLLVAAWDDQQLALRWRLGARHLVSAEYSFLAPTFDGDSIWNVFASGSTRDYRLGYDVELCAGLRAHARGFARQFVDPSGTSADARALADAAPGGRWAYGGNAGADVRGGRGRARLELYADGGYGGWKAGGDLSGRWALFARPVELEGRLTAYTWRADGTPVPQTASMVGAQAGALYRMSRAIRAHFLAEDNLGTYYRVQLRALVVLEVDVTL